MQKKKYWQTKIKYLSVLLSLWFTASILCSIVFVHQLNAVTLVVARFYEAPPSDIQEMVEDMRYPEKISISNSHNRVRF